MRDIRFRGEVFARAFTTRPIHEVDANEIEAFLRSRFEGNLNRKNYRRIISLLFSFAVKKKYILTNPVREFKDYRRFLARLRRTSRRSAPKDFEQRSG